MTLQLYNTLSRKLEPFKPLDPAKVTMYVCGPTVYNYVHIGNGRGPVVFDVLANALRRRFGNVIYARNITDVDDKINTAALERNVPIAEIRTNTPPPTCRTWRLSVCKPRPSRQPRPDILTRSLK